MFIDNEIGFDVAPFGGAELLYKFGSQPTHWINVNVVPSRFEFFRGSAGGPALADIVAADGSLKPVGLATPARSGQTIRLSGSVSCAVVVAVGGP